MNTEDEDEQEAAFRSELEFLGADLEPWSWLRRTAADVLGLRYGNLSEEEIRRTPNPDFQRRQKLQSAWESMATPGHKRSKKEHAKMMAMEAEIKTLADEPEEIVTWAGMMQDIAIVLWLRSQPDSVCHRARRKPREYEGEIDAWAEKNGIGTNAENTKRAVQVFSETLNAANASVGEPIIEGGGSGADDPNA